MKDTQHKKQDKQIIAGFGFSDYSQNQASVHSFMDIAQKEGLRPRLNGRGEYRMLFFTGPRSKIECLVKENTPQFWDPVEGIEDHVFSEVEH